MMHRRSWCSRVRHWAEDWKMTLAAEVKGGIRSRERNGQMDGQRSRWMKGRWVNYSKTVHISTVDLKSQGQCGVLCQSLVHTLSVKWQIGVGSMTLECWVFTSSVILIKIDWVCPVSSWAWFPSDNSNIQTYFHSLNSSQYIYRRLYSHTCNTSSLRVAGWFLGVEGQLKCTITQFSHSCKTDKQPGDGGARL